MLTLSRVNIYDLWANLKKLQENVLWYFLVLLGPESNISKAGQNWAITKGLNVTSKKMAAVIKKMVNVYFGPVNRSRPTHLFDQKRS